MPNVLGNSVDNYFLVSVFNFFYLVLLVTWSLGFTGSCIVVELFCEHFNGARTYYVHVCKC